MTRLVVTGGRDYADQTALEATLDAIHADTPITALIEGEAPGADVRAKAWARRRGIPIAPFPAQWDDIHHPEARIAYRRNGAPYDANAGPRRNQQMIDDGLPELAVAFPGGSGTADMVRRLGIAGIPTVMAGR